MKTAEEILMNTYSYDYNSFTGDFTAGRVFIIESMKKYAKAVLDEAKFNVSLIETNEYTTPDTETGFCDGIAAAMESMELIRKEI